MPPPDSKRARRLARLRDEITDEALPLPVDGPQAEALLEEILYAQHPPTHERRVPRYGSVVFADGASAWLDSVREQPSQRVVEAGEVDAKFLRRFADGRSSFVVRAGQEVGGLVCFDRTMEYESALVELQRTSEGTIVQRTADGLVRICTHDAVTRWDSVAWTVKPAVWRFGAPVLHAAPQACSAVLERLLELCVQWISPSQTGAILVWYVVDADQRELPFVRLSSAQQTPALSGTERADFGAILSALGQVDGAGILLKDGRLTHLGAILQSSERADHLVPPVGGTRHTSARRFSFDEPRAVVLVVSEAGEVSVFSDGARTALMRPDRLPPFLPEQALALPPSHVTKEHEVECDRCGKHLLIGALSLEDEAADESKRLTCPVCRANVVGSQQPERVRGVRKTV
ncbi:MAG: DNA integrity scanning protein DisA nucleotide-binding domain protein [Actinomycetota bacterium]|nr:DNA integrity scanning protein DisA nucleotide-binding domain protein [Actinomycetota bacterium]